MGGEGSIQAMINSIKANRQLRRKKSFFSRERSFLNRKRQYQKASEGIVNIRSATKEELAKIRNKVLKQRRKENLFIVISLILIISPIIYFSYHSFQKNSVYETQINQQILDEKTDEYMFYISDGDSYLEKGNWHNAIFQYEKALEIFPNDFEAKYRISYAYVYNCRNENKNCDLAKEKLFKLLKYFPDNTDLLELKEVLDSLQI